MLKKLFPSDHNIKKIFNMRKSERAKTIICDWVLEDEYGRASQMAQGYVKAQRCPSTWPMHHFPSAGFKVHRNQIISPCALALTTSERVATSFHHCVKGLLSAPHKHICISASYVQGLCQVEGLRISIIILNNSNNKKELLNS